MLRGLVRTGFCFWRDDAGGGERYMCICGGGGGGGDCGGGGGGMRETTKSRANRTKMLAHSRRTSFRRCRCHLAMRSSRIAASSNLTLL